MVDCLVGFIKGRESLSYTKQRLELICPLITAQNFQDSPGFKVRSIASLAKYAQCRYCGFDTLLGAWTLKEQALTFRYNMAAQV